MLRESDIVYECPNKKYWVLKTHRGFEVYETGITHSTRRATIGWEGEEGLRKAIDWIEKLKQR